MEKKETKLTNPTRWLWCVLALSLLVFTFNDSPISLRWFLYCLSAPRVSEAAEHAACQINLKGLHIALQVYVNDYEYVLPTENWCDLLIEESDVSPKSFICPVSDAIEGESSYAMNQYITGEKLNELPDDIVLLFETDKGLENGARTTPIQVRRHYKLLQEYKVYKKKSKVYKERFNQFGGPDDVVTNRHILKNKVDANIMEDKVGVNILFANGDIKFINPEDIPNLRWTVEEK